MATITHAICDICHVPAVERVTPIWVQTLGPLAYPRLHLRVDCQDTEAGVSRPLDCCAACVQRLRDVSGRLMETLGWVVAREPPVQGMTDGPREGAR